MMPHIEHAVQRHPQLNVVINHFGLTGAARDAAAFADFDKLLATARHANVAVRASCLPFYSTENYPYRGLHTYMRHAFDAFGPQRFFWGTDLSRAPGTYRQAVTLFTEELPWLSGTDLDWVMGRAVCEWMDWDGRG
jgi:predicted TIM-barrel fold metal-dependent hydrolase